MFNESGVVGPFFALFVTRLQNMNSDTALAATDATDAKTVANSTSLRPEGSGKRPGPGFCPKSVKNSFQFHFAYPSSPGEIELAPTDTIENSRSSGSRMCSSAYSTNCGLGRAVSEIFRAGVAFQFLFLVSPQTP